MSKIMKHSGIDWIGEIPASWDVVPFRSYVIERAEKNKGEKTRELLALSFALGVTLYRDKVYNKDRVKENFEDYQLVYENDIVLSPNDIIKGSVYVSKYYGCISPMYLVFSVRDASKHYLPYLSYLLRTKEAGRKFFFIARGLIGDILDNGKYVTRRMSVSRQDLMLFRVLLPSLSEQINITNFLDKKCNEIDNLISLQEKIIEELKAYKQSAITEAVTRGLNPNVPMKESKIRWVGQIPQQWEVNRLKTIGKLYGGLSGKAGDDFNVNEETDKFALFIPFTNIWNNTIINLTQLQKVKVLEGEQQNEVHKGDILFLMSSEDYEGLGKPCLMNDEVPNLYLNSFCKGFSITRKDISSAYINYLLLSTPIKHNIMSYGNGFIRINLRAEKLLNCPIIIPPLAEQEAIADYLDAKCHEIDKLISIKQQKIEELKDYRKSLIYEYVTGKKQVI